MRRSLSILFAALLLAACSGPGPGAVDITGPTYNSDFKVVDDALGYGCGSLDCHGQMGRNMRVWSKYGMRLPSTAKNPPVPGSGDTTDQEAEDTFRSVVGLEPEVMNQVFRDHGAHPERLTMIRKALGTEAHKGLKRMSTDPNDPRYLLYKCVTSWLQGQVDKTSCTDPKVAPQF